MKHALCFFPAFFILTAASAQTAEYELYKPSPDSCGHVMLYTDGTFYLGGECDAPVSTAGSWRQVHDTVFFFPRNPAGIKVVQSTTAFFTPGDTLSVEILASNGKNITPQVRLCWRLPDGAGDILLASPGNKAYLAGPPADGRLLLKVLGQEVELPSGFANNFIVKLNIPEEWAATSGWCRQSRFYLLKKDGRLLPPSTPAPVALQ